jgi:hypothetical protein
MKTPREILNQRHQAAVPKLDAIRRECVGQASRLSPLKKEKESESFTMPFIRLVWRELIFPSRFIWGGLAAVWILILAVNISMSSRSQFKMAGSSSGPAIIQAVRQQEQLLTELIGPNVPAIAEPRKPYTPRPSSRRTLEILIT